MTSDEREDSLANQAASWVPPWARERSTKPLDAPDAQEPAADGEAEAPAAQPAAGVPAPEADPEAPAADAAADVPAARVDVVAPAPQAGPDLSVGQADEDTSGDGGGGGGDSGEDGATSHGEPAAVAVPVAAKVASTGGADAAAEDVPGIDPAPHAVPERTAAAVPERTAAAASDGGRQRGSTLALISEDELRGALEAILLVVDEPVPEIVLAQVIEQPTERIAYALERIARDYTAAGHGFELRRAAGGWRLYTRPEYASYVERFILDGQSVRLTQAALETLAVVAYKQPVTRSRISAIRGVNCDGVIRTLTTRGLVEECGTEPDSGAYLYRTTPLFLEKLGLNRVDELPPLAPFLPDDVEEIEDAPR